MLPKNSGGLGLIDVTLQAKAICLLRFLWALQPGYHPLQRHIRHEANKASLLHFDHSSLTCLFKDKCSYVAKLSKVITNVLRSWDFFKGQVRQADYTL